MAAASTTGPGTASHVADRRSADRALVATTHMNSAEVEGRVRDSSSAKDAVLAPEESMTTRRHQNPAILNSPLTTTSTRSPLPAAPSSSSTPPTQTTPSKKSFTTPPSAPVTVHPSPSSSLTAPFSSPLKPPTKTMRQRPITNPPSQTTDPPPPDPALFTFPSLLTTLGPEASTPLHAIAEICGRSKMSLADEHASHMPPPGNMLAVGAQKKEEEEEEEGTQRLDGRGRGSSAPMMGARALEGEVGRRKNGGSGKGWMEGVVAWLWGEKGGERRRGGRDSRRGVEEEREGEAGQG